MVVLSSKIKQPFLSDPQFLRYKGFLVADTAKPSYELYYLPFEGTAPKPSFKGHVKSPQISEQGFVLYYTNQCPFTAKYVPLIENIARQKEVPFKSILIETTEQAQNAPAPFTTYSLFYNGEFLTNEILSEKKFEKVLAEKGYKEAIASLTRSWPTCSFRGSGLPMRMMQSFPIKTTIGKDCLFCRSLCDFCPYCKVVCRKDLAKAYDAARIQPFSGEYLIF